MSEVWWMCTGVLGATCCICMLVRFLREIPDGPEGIEGIEGVEGVEGRIRDSHDDESDPLGVHVGRALRGARSAPDGSGSPGRPHV